MRDSAVITNRIADSAITSDVLALSSIQQGKISNSAGIQGNKIENSAVSALKIANNAVSSTHIEDGAVGGDRIFPGAVTTAILGPNAVTTSHIENSSLKAVKIKNGEVHNEDIGTFQISSSHIINGEILERHLADTVLIRSTNLASLAVNQSTANRIPAGTIINRHIENSGISGDDVEKFSTPFTKLQKCAAGQSFKFTGGSWQCSDISELQVKYCPMGMNLSGKIGDPSSYTMRYTSDRYKSPQSLAVKAQNSFMNDNGAACDWKRTQQIGPNNAGDPWQVADDWVGCNTTNGWYLVSCSRGDDQVLTEDLLWRTVKNGERYFYDADVVVRDNKCTTNDWWQLRDWVMSGTQPAGQGRSYSYGMVAVCMKIK